MRLSGFPFVVVAILILSSFTVAQHHEAGAAPTAPPPPPPPSAPAVPSPAPSPSAPSHEASAPSAPVPSAPSSNSGAAQHVNTPSAPPTSFEHHSAAAVSSSSPSGESTRTSTVGNVPEHASERVVPGEKISGEARISSETRVGGDPKHAPEPKPTDPDLRHRICEGSDCKEPVAKPVAPESDLRHRLCISGNCPCAPGQKAGQAGCGTSVVQDSACPAGQSWNGSSCSPATMQCPAGQYWNGVQCGVVSSDCAGISARASSMAAELRGLHARVREACMQDPQGQECMDSTQQFEVDVQNYRMLMAEAGPRCPGTLADPSSF